MIRVLFALGFMVVTSSSQAEIYKCVDEKKKTVYSESPCGENAEYLILDENTIGSERLRNKAQDMRYTPQEKSQPVTTRYMNSFDVSNRLRELEIDIKSNTSSAEKLAACQREMSILKNGKVNKLSYDDETKRSNARRALNSIIPEIRKKGLVEIYEVFSKY